jgi:hypothetical protein
VNATQQVLAGFIFEGKIEIQDSGATKEVEINFYLKPGSTVPELQKFNVL